MGQTVKTFAQLVATLAAFNSGNGNMLPIFDTEERVLSAVSLDSYYTKSEVDDAIAAVDLSDYVTTGDLNAAISGLIGGAPALLDTLSELAAAVDNNSNYAVAVTNALAGKEPTIAAGTTGQYWRGDKSWQTLDKAAVGLSNVENAAASGLYLAKIGGTLTGDVSISVQGFDVHIGANNQIGGFLGSATTGPYIMFAGGNRIYFGATSAGIQDGTVSLGRGDYRLNEVHAVRMGVGAFIVPIAAPADGTIGLNQISFYLDESENKLKVRVCKSTGAYLTGEIALS